MARHKCLAILKFSICNWSLLSDPQKRQHCTYFTLLVCEKAFIRKRRRRVAIRVKTQDGSLFSLDSLKRQPDGLGAFLITRERCKPRENAPSASTCNRVNWQIKLEGLDEDVDGVPQPLIGG